MSFRKCVTRDAPEKKFLASLHGLKLCGTSQSYGVLYIFKLGWWPLWPQYNFKILVLINAYDKQHLLSLH